MIPGARMAIETASDLAEAVCALGLVEGGRLDELRRLAASAAAPRDLARQLLRREWLTPYQANQLLLGKGGPLVLGPYVLLARIGAGGMGEVFKARHSRLHRLAAVKVLNLQRLEHPCARERFTREAEAAAHLSHPNIIAVHDAGSDGDAHYLAMEYIDGIDLGRLLGKAGPLPFALACDFAAQAALGLHHAHEQGFVHRDIKPSNLLVAPRGGWGKAGGDFAFERLHGAAVKVLDMGLVRLQPHRLEQTHLALTVHGVVLGTLDYLPPEQARNSHRVDRRADLYSLGCTLYHLLAGRPPFEGRSAMEKLLRHQTDEPPRLGERRPDVPAALEAVLRRLMAKRPDDRFATAAEAAVALAPFAAQAPEPVLLAGPAYPTYSTPLAPTCAETPPTAQSALPTPLITSPVRTRSLRRKKRKEPAKTHWWWVALGIAVVLLLSMLLGLASRMEGDAGPRRLPQGRFQPRP